MVKTADLTGQRFGRWLILSRAEDRHKTQVVWLCGCQCGSGVKREVYATQLKIGRSKGCGCMQREACSKRPYESLYNMFCKTARERDYAIEISFEEFVTFTSIRECHYCGAAVSWSKFNHGGKGNSHAYNLDRMDNTRGYLLDNLVVCCKRCNYAKGRHFSYEEWVCMTTALKELHVKKAN